MSTIQLHIPDNLDKFIRNRMESRGYSSMNDYLLSLIIHDDDHIADPENIEQLLLEGLESGESAEMTDADWDELHQRLSDKYGVPKHERHPTASSND